VASLGRLPEHDPPRGALRGGGRVSQQDDTSGDSVTGISLSRYSFQISRKQKINRFEKFLRTHEKNSLFSIFHAFSPSCF